MPSRGELKPLISRCLFLNYEMRTRTRLRRQASPVDQLPKPPHPGHKKPLAQASSARQIIRSIAKGICHSSGND